MAQLKSTTVAGDLAVSVENSVNTLTVSSGDYTNGLKIVSTESTSGSPVNSFLQICNSGANANGQRGIELVAYYDTSSAAKLQWTSMAGQGSLTPSNGSTLGSSSGSWGTLFLTNAIYSYPKVTVSTAPAQTSQRLLLQSFPSVTFNSGTYGTVDGSIRLNPSRITKPDASTSTSTFNAYLDISSEGTISGDKLVLQLTDSGKASSSATSINTLVLKSVGDSKSSTSYNGNGMIQFECTNYSGSSSFTNTVTIGGSTSTLQMYPSASTSYLGTSAAKWTDLYVNTTYTNYITSTSGSGASYNIQVYNNLIPNTDSTVTLGDSTHRWHYVYAAQGTIQTSDRSAKDSIHYIEDSVEMKPATMSLKSTAVEDPSESLSSQITVEDVIDFVSNLSPVTFCYKDGQGEGVEATEENSEPEAIQLGLIADDIKDHKLFKYIGVETTCEEEITPAVEDEEGNIVTEAVTETKTTLGLQAIPLATAALTACKYLIQKNEEIEARLADIEDQLGRIVSK